MFNFCYFEVENWLINDRFISLKCKLYLKSKRIKGYKYLIYKWINGIKKNEIKWMDYNKKIEYIRFIYFI